MEVVIRLDSHVSFKYKKLKAKNKSCWSELKDSFTHVNPQFLRNERMGIPNWTEPEIYKSYTRKKSRAYFSRGGIKRIKKILKRWGHTIKINDKRTKGDKVNFKKKSNIKLHKIQKEPCKIMKKQKQGILHGPCCLTGDTIISINRARNGKKETLQKLYNRTNGNPEKLKRLKQYDSNIPTKVRSFNGKTIQLNMSQKIIYSGKRLVYELLLENGRKLQATGDHKIMTRKGFVELLKLKIRKSLVMCDVDRPRKKNSTLKPPSQRKRQREIDALWFHPFASKQKSSKWKRGYTKRISRHKGIYEANLNNITLDEFILITRTKPKKAKKLKYVDSSIYEIHHKDFDHFNNEVDNLEMLTISQHKKVHSKKTKFNFNQGIPEFSKVISIKKIGFKKTYDIQCEAPFHNFVANGIVVHNSSGKSVMGLKFIQDRGRRAIVVVWNKDHQKQWIEEATNKKLLNMDKRDIGGVGGVFAKRKLGKLNVCMQQSLWNKDHRDFFFPHCGTLVADEVQRFAARTCHEVVDDCPAEGRIGVTAQSKRKDGKEFLIYDVFGNVIYTIPDSAIKTRKKSKITLVPSDYINDDYDFTGNYVEMLNDMARDKKRNKLIVKRTVLKTKKKKLVLILVERKFQAMYLYDILTNKKKLKVKLLVGKTTKKELDNADDWKPSWKKMMKSYDDDKEFFEIKKLGIKRKLDVIIATVKGEVGLNIKTIDHEIITTPTGGNTERFNQQKGRVERDHDKALKKLFGNKATPTVDYIWDIRVEKIRRKGSNILKTFNNVHILQKRRKKNGKSKRKRAA